MTKQALTVAKLVREHGSLSLDHASTGEIWLRTVDGIEYVVHADGTHHVNYVHPARRPANRIAGLLA